MVSALAPTRIKCDNAIFPRTHDIDHAKTNAGRERGRVEAETILILKFTDIMQTYQYIVEYRTSKNSALLTPTTKLALTILHSLALYMTSPNLMGVHNL